MVKFGLHTGYSVNLHVDLNTLLKDFWKRLNICLFFISVYLTSHIIIDTFDILGKHTYGHFIDVSSKYVLLFSYQNTTSLSLPQLFAVMLDYTHVILKPDNSTILGPEMK